MAAPCRVARRRLATTLALFTVLMLAASCSRAASPSAPATPTSQEGSSASTARPTPMSAATPVEPDRWPTAEWVEATPESVGFDSGLLADGLQELAAHGSSLHSLLVVRHGNLVLEAYKYPYDGTIYHDLASVTKSVTTTLVGIAADRGLLDLDDPVLSFFPDRDVAAAERKGGITVRHLASLTAGMECRATPEEVTLARMRDSPDWVQFALDRAVVAEPGTAFAYCSPDMHLLSAILTRATGMSALEFARESLFAPLGIADAYWPADADGINHGWGDLALHPRDAAKIGLLLLHEGRWDGTQVVSADWVMAATTRQADTAGYKAEDYGYGWWVPRSQTQPVAFFRADGNGGQRIVVVPAYDLVIATTGGGLSLDEVVPFVLAAVTDDWQPVDENPGALDRLRNAAAALAARPDGEPVATLPDLARTVSGRAISLDANRYGVRSLTLRFDPGAAEASASFEVGHESPSRDIVIGLDGRWRPSRAGRPILARGGWTGPTTFEMQVDEGPGLAGYSVRVTFAGVSVRVELLGLADEVVTLSGRL